MMTADEHYITQRIIDACLRENLFDIAQPDAVQPCLPDTAPPWQGPQPDGWLCLELAHESHYLPVKASRYMQPWRAISAAWLVENGQGWRVRQGYRDWLTSLAAGRDDTTRQAFEEYVLEAETAVAHRHLCQLAYENMRPSLSRPLDSLNHWQDKMLHSDRIASYLDHPYYPTARAKGGFDEQALRHYAPEYAGQFSLRWIAVSRQQATLITEQPDCWPDFETVGLAPQLAQSHCLFPVHPLSWDAWDDDDPDSIKAPRSVLRVTPTLSVRTVALVDRPAVHIKLPLLMKTLGARNIRLIKPGTLYDGHWFAELLTLLAQREPAFKARYRHCDEQHGGHIDDNALQAYLVRRYPSPESAHNAPVAVAALAATMPDGRLYVQHLIDEYYRGDTLSWVDQYLDLMLTVHLRLWLQYGIALEANQQNSMLVFDRQRPLSLLMKDNDSARLLPQRLAEALPEMADRLGALRDSRILVDEDLALGQMFCTIILQLNIAAIFEAMAAAGMATTDNLYSQLREHLRNQLVRLEGEGVSTGEAKQLLYADKLYAKYLLSAGSLLTKEQSGAADINKFYGLSVPNFLRD